jgi:hypothetical protein
MKEAVAALFHGATWQVWVLVNVEQAGGAEAAQQHKQGARFAQADDAGMLKHADALSGCAAFEKYSAQH